MKSVFRKWLFAALAAITFALFYLLMEFVIRPSGQVLEKDWQVTDGKTRVSADLPYRRSVDRLTTITFSREIHYNNGDALVLTRLDGQALEVRLNGEKIYLVGDSNEPTANFWNTTFAVPLPEDSARSGNLEILLTSASYPIDISVSPYILDWETAQQRVALIDFVYNDLLLIVIGASVLIGAILVILSCMQKRGWSAEVLLGLSSILVALEGLDYIFSFSLGSLNIYFALKKIFVISGYLGAFTFVAGLEKYVRKKMAVSKIIAIPTIITAVLILCTKDPTKFPEIVEIANVVLLVDFIIAIYFIFKNSKVNNWMIFLAVWLILGLLQILSVFFSGQSKPFVMQYIILLGTCVLGTNLLLEFSRLYTEKLDLEKRVVMDTLTTAYNRNILGKASQEQYDAIILMDLDNFKAYNDKYGHQKGDQLLIKFTEIVKSNLRQEDIVIRYGGDEFLVLLHGISVMDAEQVALRICHDLEEATQPEDYLGVSYGIEKIEHSLDSDLDRADHLMYAMKQAKRIQIRNCKIKQDKS